MSPVQKLRNGYKKDSSLSYKNTDEVKKGLSDLKKAFKADFLFNEQALNIEHG